MPLSMDQMQRGAQVAVAFDERGGRRRFMRKGIIVKIETFDPVDPESQLPQNGVKKIFVQFAPGIEPEVIPNAHLALVKPFDQSQYARLKKDAVLEQELESIDRQNRLREATQASEPTVVVDETEFDSRRPVSEEELRRFESRE